MHEPGMNIKYQDTQVEIAEDSLGLGEDKNSGFGHLYIMEIIPAMGAHLSGRDHCNE
jgi:hypothetical protein